MATNELITKVEALQEWEALMEEAKNEIESIKDELKAEMLRRNTEELDLGCFIVRYQSIVSNKFDNSAFKKALPDVYKSFLRQSTAKRFSIA